MSYLNLFVVIFIVLVSVYLIVNISEFRPYDLAILALATLVLLMVLIKSLVIQSRPVKESFVDSMDIETALMKFQKLDTEEDITEIKNRLVVYLTVFNKSSFNNMGRTWNNIAGIKPDGTCPTSDNTLFAFELAPVFTRKTGLYLGNNRIIGPYSNSLGIQFYNTYTIVLACKHGNLLVDNKNTEIELLKLYANSPNNNGLSLFIQKGSLKNDNNTQTGTLMFQYANHEPLMCKVDKHHTFINFDKDVLTYYFIIKDTDNVRILMMNEQSNIIYQILKFNISNTDVTFSNKEMMINRLSNWNGNLFAVAVFDRAISDENVSLIYTHVLNEYIKNIDSNFSTMISQYNDVLAYIQSLLQCPYDPTVCNACSSVKKWTDITQIMNAPVQCRKSINDFCANNTAHPLCKCWDTSSSLFNSDTCRMYRAMFSGEKSSCLDSLTAEDIAFLKEKYGLIYPNECPTAIKAPYLIKNTYQKYDWSKLKVNLEGNSDSKIRPLYPVEEGVDDEAAAIKKAVIGNDRRFDHSPEWEQRKINNIRDGESKQDFTVVNYIKTDPQLSKDVMKDPSLKQAKDVLDLAKHDQDATKIINPYAAIATEQNTNASKSMDQKTSASKPTSTSGAAGVSDPLADTLPKPDSFFNKFMKVLLPS